jgi:predicted dehydrogenase
MERDQDVTRREFLKTATTTVAAATTLTGLGAPAILSAQNTGQAVRYGFIGPGSEGCHLLSFLATQPEGRCVAMCDIYPPNLKKGVETIGSNPDTYVDYRKLLERKDIDAVMIATPLNLHAGMIVDSLHAGKHVFCEKTLYFKEEEGDQIRQAMAAHPQLVMQVGLQRRSSVLYQVAIEMIRKGALGKLMFVRAQWHRNSNWRRPVHDPRLERQINWRMYKEYSGGLLAELASHQTDVANWAFDAQPTSVYATGGIDYWKDGRETCDNVEAIYEYSGGRKMTWSSILYNAHLDYNEQILGDRGSLITTIGKGMYYREAVAKVSPVNSKENWWAGATMANTKPQEGIPIFPEKVPTGNLSFMNREVRYAKQWLASMGIYDYEEPHDPYWSELHNFLMSVRDNARIFAPFSVGEADAKGVIYGNRSIESGIKIYWPEEGTQKA